jgi:carbon monoxide dehydrogenase subunit G
MVNGFTALRTSGSIDIEVMNDENQTVRVEADDNILPYIITRVDDGMLDVRYRSNMMFNNTHVKVYVSAPLLKKIIVGGSGSIISKDVLKEQDEIEFKVSGSGDINAIVDAPSITAGIGGSGTISLHGKTKNFSCSIGGSGDVKCKDLLSESTNVSISGSGTAHVFASVHLVAKVSGSGDIYYSGNPSSPEIHTSGSGSVEAEK